jgi:hypothetical protein
MSSQVVGTDFTNGAQLPNFANGRVLTAADLSTSQATLRIRDQRAGRAAGHGVVDGLSVIATATTLTVAQGLGLSPSGEPVTVGTSVTLPLTFPQAAAPASQVSFGCCTPATAGAANALAVGCYLLTAAPACQLQGQSPTAGAPGTTTSPGCMAQWMVEGVSFKAISLPVGAQVNGISVTDANRRNLLAHWCFGTEQLERLAGDPFSFAPGYSGIDGLDPADLTEADLPLAVFYWNGQGVGFVDNWSVRRRVTGPDPVTASWSPLVSDQRKADGEARFLQFQDQIAEIVSSGQAGLISAADVFPLLPPVGFLPINLRTLALVLRRVRAMATRIRARGAPDPAVFSGDQNAVLRNLAMTAEEVLAAAGSQLGQVAAQPGFNMATFFGAAGTCGGFLDWDVADFALRQSWTRSAASPVEQLTDATGKTVAPVLFYCVDQNVASAIAAARSTDSPMFYVVFIRTGRWVTGTQLPFTVIPSPLRFILR